MPDLMQLTLAHAKDGTTVYINPQMVCTVQADPRNGSILHVLEVGKLYIAEDVEKVLNQRRAALERNP